jgi:ATP-dependent DNA helicase MPH1
MCYDYMQEISREHDDAGETSGKAAAAASRSKKLRNDPLFQTVMREFEVQRGRGFSIHPKMDRLKALVVQHFAENMGDPKTQAEETRVMVFVTFRQVVDEIVEVLNSQRPLIRATKFIGQGTDKQGKKGMAQKEQLEVMFSPAENGGD